MDVFEGAAAKGLSRDLVKHQPHLQYSLLKLFKTFTNVDKIH